MRDRIAPYLEETYSEMMDRLKEKLPELQSRKDRIEAWRRPGANYFGDNFYLGNSVDYLKYTTAEGLVVKGTIRAEGATFDSITITGVDLDEIEDGTTYSRVLTTAITAGKILLTASAGVTGSLPVANTDADVTSAQFTNVLATIDQEVDKVELGLDGSGFLVTKVVPASNVAPTGAGLYLGADFMGYYDSSFWKTYMDSSGNFYLGGTGGTLQWNGSNLTISVSSGDALTIEGGGDLTITRAGGGAHGKINFLGDSNELEIWADNASVMHIQPDGDASAAQLYLGTSAVRWDYLEGYAIDHVLMYYYPDANNLKGLNALSTGVHLMNQVSGADKGAWLPSAAALFGPRTTSALDLGSASYYWKDLYLSGGTFMPAVYAHDMNGETIRDLQINDSGELGYDSSSKDSKANEKDLNASWLYDLNCYEYKRRKKHEKDGKLIKYYKKTIGEKEAGLFAEDLALVRPQLVYFDGDKPVGIHYKGLIIPAISEIQQLKKACETLCENQGITFKEAVGE